MPNAFEQKETKGTKSERKQYAQRDKRPETGECFLVARQVQDFVFDHCGDSTSHDPLALPVISDDSDDLVPSRDSSWLASIY